MRFGTSESPVFFHIIRVIIHQSPSGVLSQSRFCTIMDKTSLPSFAVLLFSLILVKTLFERLSSRRMNGPYPPGPKPMPIIGNVQSRSKDQDTQSGVRSIKVGAAVSILYYNADILLRLKAVYVSQRHLGTTSSSSINKLMQMSCSRGEREFTPTDLTYQ